MKKTNIMYITGDNSFLIDREKTGLTKIFQEKYGSESIEICQLDNEENFKNYSDNILNPSLFLEKRLFVFFGGRDKKRAKTSEKKTNTKENSGFEFFLENLLPHLSDTDFLLFYNLGAGEEKLKKWLTTNATLREQKFSFLPNTWEKYTTLSTPILKKVLQKYEQSEKMRDKWDSNPFLGHTIMQSISDLAELEKQNITITDAILEQFLHTYEGAKIFDVIDYILAEKNLEAKKMLDKIQNTINYINVDIFMGGFIGILRKNLYILQFRDMWINEKNIAQYFPDIHSFVISKAYKSKVSAEKLWKFYQKIILANIAYKSGKWMKKNILWRFFEIDTALLELKK